MNNIRNYIIKNKHFFLSLYAFIYIPWFMYLEDTVTYRFHEIHMAIDDKIPFCEFFVIPYYFWFAYVLISVLYFAYTDGDTCWKIGGFLIVGMTVFLIISTLYPNGHYLRPHYFTRDNICTNLVRHLYSSDTATNLFPSIHVYNSIGIHIGVCHHKILKNKAGIKTASFITMLLIIMSTMFLKQHSVFDVITALAMAAIMYSFCYGTLGAIAKKKNEEHSTNFNHI